MAPQAASSLLLPAAAPASSASDACDPVPDSLEACRSESSLPTVLSAASSRMIFLAQPLKTVLTGRLRLFRVIQKPAVKRVYGPLNRRPCLGVCRLSHLVH